MKRIIITSDGGQIHNYLRILYEMPRPTLSGDGGASFTIKNQTEVLGRSQDNKLPSANIKPAKVLMGKLGK